MLFDFRLRPISEVAAWGRSPDLRLSWFGFTDGFYRLDVGGEYLLNYSSETVELCRSLGAGTYPGPYVDYYVVRLWEDVYEILYDVLQPLPKDLQALLERDYASQQAWMDKAFAWLSATESGEADANHAGSVYDAATFWCAHRRLDSAYLAPQARIWLWSDDETVVIAWDNRGIVREGIPVWSARHGAYRLPRQEFLTEVRSFNDRLIAEMGERVREICATWNRPEIRVDFDHLRQEQVDRTTWYDAALKRPPPIYSWDEVRDAMALIDKS